LEVKLSDDKKKPQAGLPGPLPGLGNKPGGPLPGLGNKPAPGGPLPGLGNKPAPGAPLPGFGGGAPAPGGAGVPGVAPPFGQPEPEGPSSEELTRDPFAQSNLPSRRSSYVSMAPGMDGAHLGAGDFSASEIGKSKLPLLVGGAMIGLLALIVGFMGGKAVSGRVALNIAIRDALIVNWEVETAAKILGEVQSVMTAAARKAQKREFDETHLGTLRSKLRGVPIPPTVFTDRNYKNFDPAAVQWLTGYYNKWGELMTLIEDHKRETKNDEEILKASGEEAKKLMSANYGVIFSLDDEKGEFFANLVMVGNCEPNNDDEVECNVQAEAGSFAYKRTPYYPQGEEDARLAAEVDKFLVPVNPLAKRGMLKNASQSHFERYLKRLGNINGLIKKMVEEQGQLLQRMTDICSQEPVGILGGIDVDEEYETYIFNRASKGDTGAAPAPAAEETE